MAQHTKAQHDSENSSSVPGTCLGEVVKLDRGLPLVQLQNGESVRCEHATTLVKQGEHRAVIGDMVEVGAPNGHDVMVIQQIQPRRTALVRKDPTERALPQTLAANFDTIIVAQPVSQLNLRRLERELVLAFETGAKVAVVLTKADIAEAEGGEAAVREVQQRAQVLAGKDVPVVVMSADNPGSVEEVRDLVPFGETAVLIGRSGVGKSTLVNILCGEEVQKTGSVRSRDGKGRHTTVSRQIIQLPGAGRVVDMPGVRGLGLWDAQAGIQAAFSDIEQLAQSCKFRDCKHEAEPGCAVRAAVEAGEVPVERFESYKVLCNELTATAQRRERSRWKNK